VTDAALTDEQGMSEPGTGEDAAGGRAKGAPAAGDGSHTAGLQVGEAEAALAAFRRQLEGQQSVAASVVQDCLLDLWVSLPEGDERAEVERWLVETLQRNLYSVADVDARLATVVPGAAGDAGRVA
jgi:hypothetical protein